MSLNTKERTLSMLELKPLYKLYMGTLCLNQPNKKLRSVFNLMFGNICGLHVWSNLQVIPATLNLSKGNKEMVNRRT